MESTNLAVGVATLVILGVSFVLYWWRNPRCNGRLPPGSMGLPVIGETLQLLSPGSTFDDQSPFISARLKRYGMIFKTSLLGRPVVVSADEEFNQMVFQQEGKLFESSYPASFIKILGKDSLIEQQGSVFKDLKKMILQYIGPQKLKEVFIGDFVKASQASLALWAHLPSVELREATSTMLFNLIATKLLSFEESSSTLENLRKNLFTFKQGLMSFPLYIPRNIILQEFQAISALVTQSLTGSNAQLTSKQEEHEEILKKMGEGKDSCITWDDYRSMRFTSQVINEILRLGSIAPGVFRKTMKDVEYKGYTIPEGWQVMVCTTAIHLSPTIYEEPLSFNPSRWKDKAENARGFKNFMAFGGGMRLCVGADYSLLFMSIFLHCLIKDYRWKIIKGGAVIRILGLEFPEGVHIQLVPRS